MFTLTEIAVATCVGAAIGTVQAGNTLGTAVTLPMSHYNPGETSPS